MHAMKPEWGKRGRVVLIGSMGAYTSGVKYSHLMPPCAARYSAAVIGLQQARRYLGFGNLEQEKEQRQQQD
jgi:hypothetical protein